MFAPRFGVINGGMARERSSSRSARDGRGRSGSADKTGGEKPLIGVLTPTYERGDDSLEYLRGSFRRQTYPEKLHVVYRNSTHEDRKDEVDKFWTDPGLT